MTYIELYKPTVIYFGLTNSSATFQTMINDLFQDMINQRTTATFINDIIVATETEKGHDEVIEKVLKRLKENDLFVKPKKYKWKVREVEFLEVVIGLKGVEIQKEKVKGMLNWPALQNIKEVQKFLGLVNYYRQFIEDFAKVIVPLHLLVQKEEKQRQGKEQKKAFQRIKKIFISELILAIPDLDREMQVEADTSDYATEEVLSVKYKNGKQRPVVFISKSMNPMERNYKIHDKEMLAVIRCLETQRYYLEEAKIQFKIWIDYKNLQYFMTSQKLNCRQAKWMLYLSRFDFVLKHVPEKSIGKMNGLSRRLDWQEGVENNNKDRTLIKPEWVQKEVRQGEKTLIEEESLKERIKKVQRKDKRVVKVVEKLKRSGVKVLKEEEQTIEEGLILKEDQIYILEEGNMRTEII